MRGKFGLEFRIIENGTSHLRRNRRVTRRASLSEALPEDRRTVTSHCWKVVAFSAFLATENPVDARIV